MTSSPRFVVLFCSVVALAFGPARLSAADSISTTGSISGHVLNLANGQYLPHARVALAGTAEETLTDEFGGYELAHVRAGSVTVTATYTGMTVGTALVTVVAGQTASQDLTLQSAGRTLATGDQVVRLDQFTVAADRTMDNKALAINEQRVAPNLKTVVAADTFGDVTEGNIGEFLKYLPGVAIEYTAADARQIILRGINPIYTSVTIDGDRMASAASSNAERYFELEQASINNVARLEVVFSRTPDLAADALGGSVNLIGKTAFDYSHTVINYRAYFSMNDDDRTIQPTPGPFEENSHKILPGFDFTVIEPLGQHFGFVVNYLDSNTFYPQNRTQDFWSPLTSGAGSSAADPFLHTYQLMVGPKDNARHSLSADFDWKPTSHDTFSIRPQWNFYNATFANRIVNWNVQGTSNTVPVSFDSDGTQGATGAGNATFSTSFRHKFGTTYHLAPTWTHTGDDWSFEAGAAYSHATNHYNDVANGAPDNVAFTENNLTVGFAGLNQYQQVRPATITTTDKTGAPVNTFQNLGGYTLNSFLTDPENSQDVFRTVKVNGSKKINWPFPTTFSMGAQAQQEIRDIRHASDTYDFVGPDQTKGTTDDVIGQYMSSYNLIDAYSSVAPPYGLPKINWPNPYGVWNMYQAHPEWFALESHATTIKNSQYFQELITAAYLMGDTRLLHQKLRLVYGVRFERTDDLGKGYLYNPNAIYQKNPDGSLALTSAGKAIPLVGAYGLPLNATTGGTTTVLDETAAEASQLEYVDRGSRAVNHSGTGFPSANLTYNFTPELLGRLAFSRAIGRPDLSNIIPGVALPDTNSATPYTITVNNTALEPEYSNNYDASLEYYFSNVGLVSVGAFRKDFSNFYGASTVLATADELNALGVPNPSYYLSNGGLITSKFNVGNARVTGLQFAYSQGLTFLPIPGISAFVNGYMLHLEGAPNADFSTFLPKSLNWGLGYDNRKFSAKINWNYRGQERETALSGDTGAFNYFHSRLQTDIEFEYRILPQFGVFVTGRNITNVKQDYLGYGQALPDYAHLQRRDEFGSQYTMGFKGTF